MFNILLGRYTGTRMSLYLNYLGMYVYVLYVHNYICMRCENNAMEINHIVNGRFIREDKTEEEDNTGYRFILCVLVFCT